VDTTLKDNEAAFAAASSYPAKFLLIQLNSFIKFGAGEGIRTLDPNLGKVGDTR
jgi:hypothetical protein